MEHSKILLLTGATGFVGGTVLSQLLQSRITSFRIVALVRSPSQADILKRKGVDTVVIEGGLDDTDGLVKLASTADIILHAATGFHTASAAAMLKGLGQRKAKGGVAPIYLQLSGTTNLSVGTVTGAGGDSIPFSDQDGGIYEYEVKRENISPYAQRTTDVTVVSMGESLGIRTYIIMPPLVYGQGTGLFNQRSQQIPMLIRNALQSGRAEYIAPGTASIGHVHVEDLAALFVAIIVEALAKPELASGRNGYFFAGTGRHSWVEVAQYIATDGYALGALESANAAPIDLTAAAAKFWEGDEIHTERILASSSRTKAERGREIGWKPLRTDRDWRRCLIDDLHGIIREAKVE